MTLTWEDIDRALRTLPPPEHVAVAVELSPDVRQWLIDRWGLHDVPAGLPECLYGLPVRMVEGTGACRPVHEHRPLSRVDLWEALLR